MHRPSPEQVRRAVHTPGGLAAVLAAYVAWGLMPVYWKLLVQVSTLEVVCHRIVWSFVLSLLLYGCSGRRSSSPLRLCSWPVVLPLAGSAALLAGNWLLYIWAVNSGHVIDSSLGYFINPLLAVLLGLTLKERLRPLQWLCVGMAATGVLHMALALGQVPWIALGLALSFALYTLLRKISKIPALEALVVEMGLLSIPSLILLLVLHGRGEAQFLGTIATTTLLAGAGVVTLGPLLLFISGVRQIDLSTAGLLQYLSPTLSFLLGLFLYKEEFPVAQQQGFVCIWLALALFSGDQLLRSMRAKKAPLHSPR